MTDATLFVLRGRRAIGRSAARQARLAAAGERRRRHPGACRRRLAAVEAGDTEHRRLDAVSMELVPQGDFFESQEMSAADEEPPPPEEIEQPDLAIPPPQVMAPEAPALPQQKEIVEKKKKIVEKKKDVDHDKKREAQTKRRIGAPEGQSQSEGMSQSVYKALLAKVIREHTPSTAGLGEGTAHCTFHVTAGGGITGISSSGSSPAHAALARRVLSSIHAPAPPTGVVLSRVRASISIPSESKSGDAK